MNTLAAFLVRRRIPLFILTLILAAGCGFLMLRVEINTDLTKYLPASSSMKQGIDIMKEEFSGMTMSSTVRVMLKDVPEGDAQAITDILSDLPAVTAVTHIPGSEQYEKDGYSLFVISSDAGYGSAEMKELEDALQKAFSESADQQISRPLTDYELVYSMDTTSSSYLPVWIIAAALGMILVILLIMTPSWIEPFLFLVTIGIAVLINLGTNYFKGSISDNTFTIAALLQLVLSMDYSVILSSRYHEEILAEPNPKKAMQQAIAASFSSIASSSLTTVAGLLALIFMSFSIGADMGIVLAKGVLCSLLCILTVLPALMVLCSGAIRRTRKPVPVIPTGFLAAFSARLRHCILIVFLVSAGFLFILKSDTPINFTLSEPTEINKVFPKTNQIVLLYNNKDEQAAQNVASLYETNPDVLSVTTYAGTLGRKYTCAELSEALPELIGSMGSFTGPDLPVDDTALISPVLSLIYYEYYTRDQDPLKENKIKLSDLFDFLIEQKDKEPFASLIPADVSDAIEQFGPAASGILNLKTYSAEELIGVVHTVVPNVDENLIRLLCIFYFSQTQSDETWTMTLPDLLSFTADTLAENPMYTSLMSEEIRESLSSALEAVENAGDSLRGRSHSMMVLDTTLEDEGTACFSFLDALAARCSDFTGDWHLIGNTPMAWEMSKTFSGELNKITLITAGTIFLVVLITFRSLLIPLVLVLLIQTAVYATMVIINLQGQGIYYLALLMVQSILMGATIDYAILFTNRYRENRRHHSIRSALKDTYRQSIGTIMTSGTIIVVITAILGYAFPNPTIGQICHTISKGSAAALVLIIFILPGVLAMLDGLIIKRGKRS